MAGWLSSLFRPEANAGKGWHKPAPASTAADISPGTLAEIRGARESGDLALAQRLLLAHLARNPGHTAGLFELALLLRQEAKDEDALGCVERILAVEEDHLDALRLGVALAKRFGKWQQAIAWMSLIAHRPGAQLDDWFFFAQLLRECQQPAKSVDAIAEAMRHFPDDVHLLVERGLALRELNRYAEAESDISRAYAAKPDDEETTYAWAIILSETARAEEAVAIAAEFAEKHPKFLRARACHASALKAAGRLDEGVAVYESMATDFPQRPEPWMNLAHVYPKVGRFDDAIAAGRRAISLAPQTAYAHINLAMSLLSQGLLGEAWPHYQWRYQALLRKDYPIPPCPADPLVRFPSDLLPFDCAGRRIALIEDQGLGDELSFLRFGPLLRERGAHVTYVPDPKLATLVARSAAVDLVTPAGANAPENTEIYLAPGDLPLLLDISSTERIPPPLPLSVDQRKAAELAARLAPLRLSGRPLVGVTWRGGTHSVRGDRLFKTISPQALALILKDLPVEVVVLQRAPLAGEVEEFVARLGRPAHDFSDLNADLEAMLALLDCLDDYLTVSNTNVHLRAGLAKPACILVPFPADYRWMATGRDSPWFPGFRIYRQAPGGRWDNALYELQADLWQRFARSPPATASVPGEWPTTMRNMAAAVANRCIRIGAPADVSDRPERVNFVTLDSFVTGRDGAPQATLASTRYRVLLPGLQLARRGFEVRAFPRPEAGWGPAAADDLPEGPVVFSKSFSADNVDLAARLKQRGYPIYVDLCDNHFGHPQFGEHMRALCGIADKIIANTSAMADAVSEATGRQAMVIGDPVEGPRGEAAFAPRFPVVKILWFGHPSNLDSLRAAIGQLTAAAARHPLELAILTQKDHVTESLVAELNAAAPGRLGCYALPWSTEATWRELERCDLVVIPSLADDRRSVKSPNRLLETIWAGRLAVVHPLPSYQAFGDFCRISEDLAEGIAWAVENQSAVLERIRAGQDAIAFEHSAWKIAGEWESAIRGGPREAPVRLHLGCGDRILPGHINIDTVSDRRGARPDVIGDLQRLPMFPEDFADEILSIHLIGHFWRWEVETAMREWLRILKPSGLMVIECGNLATACGKFVDEQDAADAADQRGQHTMWVLYGDPAWKDPLMTHHWGYTPRSLEELMKSVGLVSVRQEPAQFKLKEPRDMRLVGEKPIHHQIEQIR